MSRDSGFPRFPKFRDGIFIFFIETSDFQIFPKTNSKLLKIGLKKVKITFFPKSAPEAGDPPAEFLASGDRQVLLRPLVYSITTDLFIGDNIYCIIDIYIYMF